MQNYSLDRIIDNMPSAVLALNDKTDILYGNLQASVFAGIPREGLIGLRGGAAFKCIHANDVQEGCGYGPQCMMCGIRTTVENTLKTHENVSSVEVIMHFEDKGERILTVNTVYLGDDNIVIVALCDITDLKKLEKIRVEKEQLSAAIMTSGGVCHEMNQPLTAVNGYIELSLMDIDKNSPVYENLTTALEEMKRLKHITHNLMNLHSFKTKEYVGKNSFILDIERSSKLPGCEIAGFKK